MITLPPSRSSWESAGIKLELRCLAALGDLMRRSTMTRSKVDYIAERAAGKTVLDLGCVDHSLAMADIKQKRRQWLHGVLAERARRCVGVDHLSDEVARLREQGYEIIVGDITDLRIGLTFELVVAADVIEHLTNVDGLFRTAGRHLEPRGELIISTPNPFSLVTMLHILLRGVPLINSDHACWFDPKTLLQAAARYGFVPVDLAWIRNGGKLSQHLLHGTSSFGLSDFFTGFWSPAPTWVRLLRAGLQRVVFRPLDLVVSLLMWRRYWSSDYVMTFRLEAKS